MNRIKEWVQKRSNILFFMGGFLFDLLTLGRIDNTFNLLQQFFFMVVLIFLYRANEVGYTPGRGRVGAYYKLYKKEAFHFVLGALLSGFTIFYFKSSSFRNSFIFMLGLLLLLVLNETPLLKKKGKRTKLALISLSIFSYMIYLVPILLKQEHWSFVYISSGLSILLLYFATGVKLKKWKEQKDKVFIPLFIFFLYLASHHLKWIPPVPVSLKHLAVYHEIKKDYPKYHVTYYRPWWKFWMKGDDLFYAAENDKIYAFFQVFSPSEFQTVMKIEWLKKKNHHWIRTDLIPVETIGGREDGYRGFTYKSNYTPGEWQVRILTKEEREIGRYYFKVILLDHSVYPGEKIEEVL
jgi:hypothetical protein